jgi:hypothetical protein
VSKKPARSAEAHDGFHRELAGTEKPSPEAAILEHAAQQRRDVSAESELAELAANVAGHPLAGRVLEQRRAGVKKAGDVARALDVRVEDVYRANDVLRRNLRAIRKRKGRDVDDDDDVIEGEVE